MEDSFLSMAQGGSNHLSNMTVSRDMWQSVVLTSCVMSMKDGMALHPDVTLSTAKSQLQLGMVDFHYQQTAQCLAQWLPIIVPHPVTC